MWRRRRETKTSDYASWLSGVLTLAPHAEVAEVDGEIVVYTKLALHRPYRGLEPIPVSECTIRPLELQ